MVSAKLAMSAQTFYVVLEDGDLVHHYIPENLILQHIVTVSQDVSQPYDLVHVRDLAGKGWMFSSQAGTPPQ